MKKVILFLALSLGAMAGAEQRPIFVCYEGNYNEISYEVFSEGPIKNPYPELTLVKTKSVPGFGFYKKVLFPNVRATHYLWNEQTFVPFFDDAGEVEVLQYNPLGRSVLTDHAGKSRITTCHQSKD